MAPSPRTGHRTASGSSEPTRRISTGGRLLRHDRRLGRRFVAGADEAGRGCLAGPLVAAGVLLDLERLSRRDVRDLRALNDSKQHDHDAREALYPVVMRVAAKVAIVSRSASRFVRCRPRVSIRLGHLDTTLTFSAVRITTG